MPKLNVRNGVAVRAVLRIMIAILVFQLIAPANANALNIDESAREYFSKEKPIGGFSWFGNKVMGNGFPNLLLGAGFWGYGAWKKHPQEEYAGIAQLETVVASGVTVALIKSMTNRDRPDGSDKYSFPSAHTAYAFSTASVLASFYGPYVGVPMYALATLTAVARMQDDRHWLTDTLGGAGIGIAFGLLFAHINKKHAANKQTEMDNALRVSPTSSINGPGLSLTLQF